MIFSKRHLRPVISVLLTLVILGTAWSTTVQFGLFLVTWGLLLWPLRRVDILVFILVNLNFIGLNTMAFQKGFFQFTHPDLLQLPYWEFFMWGYFAVLLDRFFRAAPLPRNRAIFMGLIFPLPFILLTDQTWITISSFVLLLAYALILGKSALPVFIFSLIYGGVFEWIGVGTGQWSYPSPNLVLGFPLWGFPMWIGTALTVHFIIYPVVTLILNWRKSDNT